MASITTPDSNGGYRFDLVSKPPDRLICKRCHLPSRDPHLSLCCGNVFCKSCLNDIKKDTPNCNACPICRNEGFVAYRHVEADLEVKNLHIYCSNKEKGCKWHGELNDINNHLGNSDGCQFEEVKCFNECKKMIERRYLTSHVETECPRRKVNCQYCNDTGEHQFIEGHHKEECSKLPLPCPSKCKVESVLREDMEAHRKECPLEMIQCEYHNVGCEVRMARKDREKHENQEMREHLLKTKCKLTDTENKLTDTSNQLAKVTKDVSALEVSLYLAVNYPASYRPTSSAVLTSSLKWSDKLIAMVTLSNSGDQEFPVILKLIGYDEQKKKNNWNSNPFYTHNKGYKMCLNVNTGGYGSGKGTHLSAYLCLMKGSHDDELMWPQRGQFEIKLLNQISDSEHHTVIVNYDDRSGGRVTKGDSYRFGTWSIHFQ